MTIDRFRGFSIDSDLKGLTLPDGLKVRITNPDGVEVRAFNVDLLLLNFNLNCG
jgi:hypothetical protein